MEFPFRLQARFPTARLLQWSSAVVVLIAGLSALAYATDGWPERYSAQSQAFDDGRMDFSPSRSRCHIGAGVGRAETFCRLGGDNPSVVLWGDSHGVEVAQAIANAGVPTYAITYSSCSPGLGLRFDDRRLCDEHNASVFEFIRDTPQVSTVVLSARYPEGDTARIAAIAHTADALLAVGKRVVVIGPVPTPGYNVPDHLASGGDAEFSDHGPDRAAFTAFFSPGIGVIMPSDTFCSEGICDMVPGGDVLLFDDHHLSMSAAEIFALDVLRYLSEATMAPPVPTSAEGE